MRVFIEIYFLLDFFNVILYMYLYAHMSRGGHIFLKRFHFTIFLLPIDETRTEPRYGLIFDAYTIRMNKGFGPYYLKNNYEFK